MHRAGDTWIGLEPDRFEEERQPARLDLMPGPRSPIVWRFREQEGGAPGRLLNVVGWLEGGLVSVSTRGTLYLRKDKGGTLALYLPDAPKRVELGTKPPKILSPEGRKKPLYPDTWPKHAVRQAIRYRFRTIVVLDADALLAELRSGPA